MSLKEFIEKFICRNSLVRLWKKTKDGYEMISEDDDKFVCMEHEILNDKCWQSKYKDYKVLGIKDIVVNDFYMESINIVLDI